jgi:hypothetical protein
MIKLTVLRAIKGKAVNVVCTRSEGQWSCVDPAFLRVLNMIGLPTLRYYPDRELALVQLVKSYYGGTIEDLRPPAPSLPEDAIP